MKKTIPLLLIAALLFSGCTAPMVNGVPALFESPFRMTADYTVGEINGILLFEMLGVEHCTLEYLSPVSVAGMKLTLKNNVVTSTFLDVTTETTLDDLPHGSPFRLLCALTQGKIGQPISKKEDSGNITYEYENGCRIVVGSGIPRQIEAPGAEFSLKITGFERLNGV